MSTPQPPTNEDSNTVDYKTRLDEAASSPNENFQQAPSQDDKPEGTGAVIVDKVSHIVPAVKKVLGREDTSSNPPPQSQGATKQPEGPPNRPHHDPQIEEFIRDQHKSVELGSLDE